MFKILHRLPLPLALILSIVGLTACGGSSGGMPDDAVAVVGKTPILKSDLTHWVATFIRGDYYQVTGHKAPAGLATDPPNYGACASAAVAIAAQAGAGKSKFSAAERESKCHQLYRTIRSETLGYLISVLWSIGQATEQGYKITDKDINERIAELKSESYPKPGQFETFLANKGWSRADLRYIVKRNLLVGEVFNGLRAKVGNAGGEKAAAQTEHTLARLIQKNATHWTAKTSCRAAYVVEQCRQYKGQPPPTPSAAVLFEQMAAKG